MKIASKMPEPQLMTTRLMIRLNSIWIFSKVGNLGQGYILDLASRGGLSLRDEYCRRSPVKFQRNLSRRYATKKLIFPIGNITQLHHHPRWQVGGGVYFKQKKRQHSFEVALYIFIHFNL